VDGGSICKSCGAILPLPDLEGNASCLSCGRNHRVATPEPEPVPTPTPSSAPRFDPTGAGDDRVPWTPDLTGSVATVPARNRTASSLGCLLSVLVVIGAISAAVVVFARSVSTDVRESLERAFDVDSSRLSLGSGAVLVLDDAGPGGRVVDGASGAPVVAAVVYDAGHDARFVSRLPLTAGDQTPDPVWSSEPFPTSTYDAALAQIDGTVLAGVADEVWALDAATGARSWTAPLPDKVGAGCPTCFTVFGDTLVVVTEDEQVHAFGAASASPRWTRRLESPSARVVVSDAGVVISDQDPAKPGTQLITVLDPASGAVRSALSPTCPGRDGGFPTTMNFADSVLAVPGSPDLVAGISFGGTCLVRWDGTTGQLRWTTTAETGGSLDDDDALITADRLFAPTADGAMLAVDLTTGGSSRLALPPDVTAVPVAVSGPLLVAETTTTRGTIRGGLAAWDLGNGQAVWQSAMPDGSKPFSDRTAGSSESLFPDSPLSMVVTVGTGLQLATFSGDTYTATIRPVDPATGALGEPRAWSFGEGPGIPSLRLHRVTPDGLLITADNALLHLPFAADGEPVGWPAPG
jgi:outer membrane protein assembly factor BamB